MSKKNPEDTPYDRHQQFSRAEMDVMFLRLISAMATTWDRNNNRGPYANLLDELTRVACGDDGEVSDDSTRYFRERVDITLERGTDEHYGPPVAREGNILHFIDYVPFRKKWDDITDNRSSQYNAPWTRAWHTFTGRAKIESESGTMYYCRVLDVEDDEDALWPVWERNIRIPKRDVFTPKSARERLAIAANARGVSNRRKIS